MTTTVTEWEFVADAASRINEIIQANRPTLPFVRAKVEKRARGSLKRRDLTLLGQGGEIVLTGEIKMPWANEGHSPFVETVIRDARRKAESAHSEWFFTWNVNELVLWKTSVAPEFARDRHFKRYQIATVSQDTDFDNDYITQGLRQGISDFLFDFAQIVLGTDELHRRPPDDYFIESLESFLERPIQVAFWELLERNKKPAQRDLINQWMLKDQGWTLVQDDQENLHRAAKFATFAVVNKLVFYEALRKRFPSLPLLKIPTHISSGQKALEHLATFFAKAKEITRDYETVFGIESGDLGTRIPFYAKESVESWRNLVDHIDRFDFSQLDYDVIGRIFERLISPEERHRYGQYYTRPEVVDLINSFCIRHGGASVLDPACGGGTFLVRAYARKRKLAPQLEHGPLLTGLYGVDISHFAAHLSTINLASRDLIDAENYPRVVRGDFFDVSHGTPFMRLPGSNVRSRGLGKKEKPIQLEQVDAVVGNPPYLRQEDIRKAKKKPGQVPARGTKDYYQYLVKKETGIKLSGRSDLHCYFWGHASTFLKPNGWLGLLTSSQWLDVEYGFKLQGWLLENFRIVAILESRVEPWFVGARVATTITIAVRDTQEYARTDNIIRFVELRAPLSSFLLGDGTSFGMIEAADRFRDELMTITANTATDSYRVRLVRQGDMYDEGVALGRMMESRICEGKYFGGKWGIHLRAPDIWFALQDRTRERWAQIGKIGEVRRGITTGADKFFYVRDVTRECLDQFLDPRTFAQHFGVGRVEVENGPVKLVRTGTGEVWPVEAEYLEPEIHSLMEIDGFTVTEANCARLVLMVDKYKRQLRGTFVEKYITWGEEQGLHERPTCASRVTEGDSDRNISQREWYDLTRSRRGGVFWPKSQQYKHVIPTNDRNIICNCNLYYISPIQYIDLDCFTGILNSTLVVLSKQQYGRPVGVEGNLKTEVIDVNMMLIPNPVGASRKAINRVASAFNAMKTRKILGFLSERRLRRMALIQKGRESQLENLPAETELDQPDRHELDDAVFELLGISDSEERVSLRDELYEFLREHYEAVRQKEEAAILNKKRVARGTRLTPDEIAKEIFSSIKEEHPGLIEKYQGFLTPEILNKCEGLELPSKGKPEIVDDMVTKGVRFAIRAGKGRLIETHNVEEARLVALVATVEGLGRHEFFPIEAELAAELYNKFSRHVEERETLVQRMVEERTADFDLQEEIAAKVLRNF